MIRLASVKQNTLYCVCKAELKWIPIAEFEKTFVKCPEWTKQCVVTHGQYFEKEDAE